MSLKSRLKKVESIQPASDKVYYMGWANCTWSKSEDLCRDADESKEDFCVRVYKITKKQYLWLD